MVSAHHLKAWATVCEAKVTAICDLNPSRAADRAAAFGVERTYQDTRQMLEQEQPEAIDIATSPDTHADIVSMASDRGVHVLCQKPLCPTLTQAQALVSHVAERVRLMVHENWRFRPYYQQATQWIREGCIGDVVQCRLAVCSSGLLPQDGRPGPGLVRQPFLASLRRLIIAELLVHHLDVVRLMVGAHRVLACRTGRISPDVVGEDWASVFLEGANGCSIVVQGNLSSPGAPPLPMDSLELMGTRGSIFFRDATLSLDGPRTVAETYDLTDAYQQSYTNAISHFVECLRTGQPFETSARDHLETLHLVEEAYACAVGQAFMA
jgi:D-apiose dehydrogenase